MNSDDIIQMVREAHNELVIEAYRIGYAAYPKERSTALSVLFMWVVILGAAVSFALILYALLSTFGCLT